MLKTIQENITTAVVKHLHIVCKKKIYQNKNYSESFIRRKVANERIVT